MMRTSQFELRPLPYVALAYVTAPAVGLTLLWLAQSFADGFSVSGLVVLLVLGGMVCLTVEFLVLTPLLLAFQRFRWSWLNGWTGAAIGFLLGFLAGLGPGFLFGYNTFAGWQALSIEALNGGAVGLIGAVVFRVVAVRSTLRQRKSALTGMPTPNGS